MITRKHLLPLIHSTAIAVFVIWLIATCVTYSPSYPVLTLDRVFEVSINGERHFDVELFELYKIMGSKLKRGDSVSVTTTLPDMGDVPFPAIMFRSRYTTLTCYIDGHKIYEFGQGMYHEGKFIGKMYHFIPLPNDYAGKDLLMVMNVSEPNAFTSLAPISMGSQPDVESRFIHEHMTIIATGMFLIVFGMVFLCIALFFVVSFPDIMSFLVGSLFCVNLGIWVMSYYNVLSPFLYTPYETELEYFTLYLIVPYCFIMVYFIQKIEKKRLYMTCAALAILITLVQYVLHYIFNIHMRVTLPLYHIVGTLGFVLIAYFVFRNIIKKDISASAAMQMTGLVAFSISELIHLVIYMLDTLHIRTSSFVSMLIINSGCLIFVMSQLANYMLFISQAFAQRQEHASLSHLAYADGLTNLPNRARADKELSDLDNSDDDYAIISVDLNGLKPVNDDYGHIAGDKYIKDFSKVLLTTFQDDGFCARIGGDEFLVILKNVDDKDIDTLIGRMTSALSVMNALYTDYKRSVATGYAFRHEAEGGLSHEVYLLADQRMYEAKRKMHEELGILTRL